MAGLFITMIVAVPKEIQSGEKRVAATPETVRQLVQGGLTVKVQAGAGAGARILDEEYAAAGASIVADASQLLAEAGLVAMVNPPAFDKSTGKHQVDLLQPGAVWISFFQTTREPEALEKLRDRKITAFSMHLLPRTTLAQKMDALSSQSNIAGYRAVLVGAVHLGVFMPLLMTAAGTIPPARVLVLGAGVAGLQAIATAKRLGAQVEAFDVRPEVKEEVKSLGARFVEVPAPAGEGVGSGGYARETSADYQARQKELIAERIARSDLVITTALIPGKPAPLLIPRDMVAAMKPGAVIIDLAAENGGNCELTEPDRVIVSAGVTIDGTTNLPSTMPVHASQLYARNLASLITHLCPQGELNLDREDEIVSGAMFLLNGEVVHEPTREALKGAL